MARLAPLSIAPWMCLGCLAALRAEPPASVPASTGFPFTNEMPGYTVSWASGGGKPDVPISQCARDGARTPLAIRVPLSLGTFSMELAR